MLWAVFTFSSGMPLLYPVASMFYFVYFWVNKALLLFYYQRTSNFDEGLPLMSTDYLSVGIACHLIVGLIVLTNDEIITGSSRVDTSYFLPSQQQEGFFSQRLYYSDHATLYYACFLLFFISQILRFFLEPFAQQIRAMLLKILEPCGWVQEDGDE
jgi:hypothetical protein